MTLVYIFVTNSLPLKRFSEGVISPIFDLQWRVSLVVHSYICSHLTFALMTTGAFSRNVSKLLSELKLVTDNLLFSYIFKFSAQNHTTATHTTCDKHLTVHVITSHLQFSVQMGIQKFNTLQWHAGTNSVPQRLITWLIWDLNSVSKLLPILQKLATWLKWPQVKVTTVSGFTEKVNQKPKSLHNPLSFKKANRNICVLANIYQFLCIHLLAIIGFWPG